MSKGQTSTVLLDLCQAWRGASKSTAFLPFLEYCRSQVSREMSGTVGSCGYACHGKSLGGYTQKTDAARRLLRTQRGPFHNGWSERAERLWTKRACGHHVEMVPILLVHCEAWRNGISRETPLLHLNDWQGAGSLRCTTWKLGHRDPLSEGCLCLLPARLQDTEESERKQREMMIQDILKNLLKPFLILFSRQNF